MTNEERIAYLLDKLAACETAHAKTVGDLLKQLAGSHASNERYCSYWQEERNAHAATKAKLAALEGGAK
jgi:rubrerythrin